MKATNDKALSIIEAIQDMIFIQDLNGNITYVNKAGVEQSGYSKKELVNMNLTQLISPEYYPLMQELHLKRLNEDRNTYTYEMEFINKNKEIIPVLLTSSNIYKNNRLESFFCILRNNSELKKIENNFSLKKELNLRLCQTNSIEFALKEILNFTLKICNLDAGGIYVFDEKTSRFNIEAYQNVSDKNLPLIEKATQNNEFLKTPIFLNGRESTDKIPKELIDVLRKKEKIKFISIIPYYYNEKIIGSLNIGSRTLDDIPEPTKEILLSLSQEIACTISRIKAEELLKKSEKNYKEIVEYANSIIAKFDKKLKILSMNSYGLNFFGFRIDEILEKSAFETIIPDYDSYGRDLRWLVKDILENKDIKSINIIENTKKNGERVWINWTNKPIQDKDGTLLYFLAVGNDITEQIKLQEEVKNSELKLKTLFNNAYDPIFILDKNFFVKDTNNASTLLFGYPREKFIGKSIYELAAPLETKRLQHIAKKASEDSSISFETNFIKNNGIIFPAEFNLTSLELTGEKSIMCTIRDITSYKQKENDLKRQILKYNLNEGNIYLSKDPSNLLPFEAFKELVGIGYKGIIISRNEFQNVYDGDIGVEYYWLSSIKGPNTLSPDFNQLKQYLSSIEGRKVIFLDSIDHLIVKNGFNEAYLFLSWLREMAYFDNHIIIVSIDSKTIDLSKIKLLEKETKPIHLKHSNVLTERMLDILAYISNQNKIGINPCYSNLGNDMNVTRPTVRKNIRFLESNKYILVHKKGRSKRIEITDKGKLVL